MIHLNNRHTPARKTGVTQIMKSEKKLITHKILKPLWESTS
jgi:hypothetical protein